MMNQAPWICPRCQAVNAPWVAQCSCTPGATQPARPMPVAPSGGWWGVLPPPWYPTRPITVTLYDAEHNQIGTSTVSGQVTAGFQAGTAASVGSLAQVLGEYVMLTNRSAI